MVNLAFILMQAVLHGSDSTAAGSAPTEQESLPFIKLVLSGGVIMIPIALLFISAVYIFFERLILVRKTAHVDKGFMRQIQDLVQDGKIDAARELCKRTDTPVSRMLDKGLRKIGKPIDDIEKALESAGKLEVYNLEKNLSILGTISGIAPMFGFIGTIMGVIHIFYNIQLAKTINIEVVAGGLYQKMVTSAAGLIVGIFAHAAYHYLLLKIDKEIYKMEANAIEFIDLLQEPTL